MAPAPAADSSPCGLVVVDKPAGPTSHDVVDRLRRLYRTRKVGHAGTLDPPATGLLLVGLGRATRILAFLQALPKAYQAVIRFGVTTSTQDAAGEVLQRREPSFTREALDAGVAVLVGDIAQVPPMVSAVRIGGERLYAAARRGEEVERPARPVTVYAFTVESFDAESSVATVEVRCSSGTYVRTLAADLGESLGCGAHLASLRRTGIGSLGLAEAVTLRALEEMQPPEREAAVLPMSAALRDLAVRRVSGDELAAVRHGRTLPWDGTLSRAGGPALEPDGAGACGGLPHGAGAAAGDGLCDGNRFWHDEGAAVAVVDDGGGLVAVYRRSGGDLVPAAVLVGE